MPLTPSQAATQAPSTTSLWRSLLSPSQPCLPSQKVQRAARQGQVLGMAMDLQCLVLGRDYCTGVALPFLLSPEMLLVHRDWGLRGTGDFILQVKFLVGKLPLG